MNLAFSLNVKVSRGYPLKNADVPGGSISDEQLKLFFFLSFLGGGGGESRCELTDVPQGDSLAVA